MHTILTSDREAMGRWVAEHAAADLRTAIDEHGIGEFGRCHRGFAIRGAEGIGPAAGFDWSSVHGFHLDEYVGLPATTAHRSADT